MKKIRYLLLFLSIFLLLGCVEEKKKEEKKEETKEITGDYKLGEEFDFMSFKVKVDDLEDFVKIENDLSADNGKIVIKVPVTIKNKSEEKDHLSMFYYKMYNPEGEEILSKGQYFDDSLDYAPDLDPEQSYKKYVYMPYTTDGSYVLEFNNFSKKIKIVINSKK